MEIINGKYKEYRLDNGLVVALQNTSTMTATAKLRVNFGSSHEKEEQEGLAHYLEHCLASGGSAKYDPTTADEIRGLFGYSNAFTNIGRTFFVGQMLTEDLEAWIDYTSDHVFRPRFDKDRINGERERVLREISDTKSDPAYPTVLEFNEIFYRGHPKGKSTLGKEEVVRNASQDVMRSFHGIGYHPNNMELIIVGGLPENIEELVENYFGKILRGRNTRREFPELKPLSGKTIIRRSAPEIFNADNPEESSAQISFSYLGPVSGHEDEYAVWTMNLILGGGDTNSLLFQNVGLKKGLAYNVGATADGDYNAGVLGINAAVPANRIDEAVDSIFGEIQRMKIEKVNDKLVDRVKRMAKYGLAKAFESNEGHVSAIEVKMDEGLTPELFIEGYDKVTPERVMEVANKYLPDKEEGAYVLYIRDPLGK